MKRVLGSFLLLLVSNLALAQSPDMTVEPDINRIGMDYRNFALPKASVQQCREACAQDPRCQAFTFVRPAARRKLAHCWLKDGVPPATESPCCVSGVKRQAAAVDDEPREPLTPGVPDAGLNRLAQPVARGAILDALAADPNTASQLRSAVTGRERTVADLAGTSLSGVAAKAAQKAPSESKALELIELDWEAGVQFTPRIRWGQLDVQGMYLPGTESLDQLHANDHLYIYSKDSSIRWSSAVHPGPGTYALAVQIRMPLMHANAVRILVHERDAAGMSMREVTPLAIMKYPDTPGGYVDGIAGLLTLHKTSELKLLITTSTSGFLPVSGAIFAGFTLTRL